METSPKTSTLQRRRQDKVRERFLLKQQQMQQRDAALFDQINPGRIPHHTDLTKLNQDIEQLDHDIRTIQRKLTRRWLRSPIRKFIKAMHAKINMNVPSTVQSPLRKPRARQQSTFDSARVTQPDSQSRHGFWTFHPVLRRPPS